MFGEKSERKFRLVFGDRSHPIRSPYEKQFKQKKEVVFGMCSWAHGCSWARLVQPPPLSDAPN